MGGMKSMGGWVTSSAGINPHPMPQILDTRVSGCVSTLLRKILQNFDLTAWILCRVVRNPINANPRLKVNWDFHFAR